MTKQIDLGDEVEDIVTGVIGIVIAKSMWLNGCVRLSVQPQGIKDGKSIPAELIDIDQLKLLTSEKVACAFREIVKNVTPALEHQEPEKRRATGGPTPELAQFRGNYESRRRHRYCSTRARGSSPRSGWSNSSCVE